MVSLDWMSIVLSDDRQEIIEYLTARLGEVLGAEFTTGGGLHGYDFSRRSEGVVMAYGGENQRHTLLLSLSGSACSVLSWYGSAALVRALVQRFSVKVKFSRLDLALDVPGEWWQYFDCPNRVAERLQDKRVKAITIVNNYEVQIDRSGHTTENWVVTGHTTYIGSRTSERFMRIYKKKKEDGSKVTRFEYELKERYAAVVGSMLLSGESIGAAYIFANSKHVDISDIFDLSQIYEEPCASLPKKKETSRFLWLMKISAALVEFIEGNPLAWGAVLDSGRAAIGSPVGNTGVQIPEWLDYIDKQALNLETFGTIYHPIPQLRMS